MKHCWGVAAAWLLSAGAVHAQDRGIAPDAVPVVVVPGDGAGGPESPPPPGVAVDLFAGPLLFGGASELRDDFTLFAGFAMRGITARDLLGAGDLVETGLRAGYGVVEVNLDAAIREEFVIIAGGEPFALTGNNPVTGTERLGLLAVTADVLYAFPSTPASAVVPFVVAGAGFVHLIGDSGAQSAAARAGAGLEWRVSPVFAVTAEFSDLFFRARVLGRGTIHAWGVMAGVRWRF